MALWDSQKPAVDEAISQVITLEEYDAHDVAGWMLRAVNPSELQAILEEFRDYQLDVVGCENKEVQAIQDAIDVLKRGHI